MKMHHILGAGIAAAALSVAAPAFAGPIGTTGQFNQTRVNGYHSGDGGEFTVSGFGSSLSTLGYGPTTSNQAGLVPSFQTFCLESDEFVGGDPTHFIVNDKVVDGGSGGPSPDPISIGTAWLYSQFAAGTLTGYNYTPGAGRNGTAADLQKAIWWLEEETSGVNNAFVTAASVALGLTAAQLRGDAASGQYGIYVLNTYADANRTQKRQDFLYSVPDGGATLALLGGALLAIGAARRRFAL